jgi:hypothetical protein
MPYESAIDPADGATWIRPDGLGGMRQSFPMPALLGEQQGDIPIQDRATAGTTVRNAISWRSGAGDQSSGLAFSPPHLYSRSLFKSRGARRLVDRRLRRGTATPARRTGDSKSVRMISSEENRRGFRRIPVAAVGRALGRSGASSGHASGATGVPQGRRVPGLAESLRWVLATHIDHVLRLRRP